MIQVRHLADMLSVGEYNKTINQVFYKVYFVFYYFMDFND